jgi:hypothetical protein
VDRQDGRRQQGGVSSERSHPAPDPQPVDPPVDGLDGAGPPGPSSSSPTYCSCSTCPSGAGPRTTSVTSSARTGTIYHRASPATGARCGLTSASPDQGPAIQGPAAPTAAPSSSARTELEVLRNAMSSGRPSAGDSSRWREGGNQGTGSVAGRHPGGAPACPVSDAPSNGTSGASGKTMADRRRIPLPTRPRYDRARRQAQHLTPPLITGSEPGATERLEARP